MTTNQNEGFDFTDPVGTWRTIRDANLDAWAKGMATMVNTETFSKALGIQLDTMLAASAPMQKAMNQYMEAYLKQANLPSRSEMVSLAQRMTNIEMRLDDMDARLDDILAALRALATPALVAEPAEDASAAEANPESDPATKPAARRTRRTTSE